ncbi:MAG: twin-arginine translocation signal domain-containing protein [Halanaeroarchaeum sp.]
MPSPRDPSVAGGTTSRRRFLAATATGAVGALAGCQRSAAPPPLTLSRWWRQYGYDAANTAYNPDARVPTDAVVEWTHRAGAYHRGNQPLAIPAGVVVNTGYDGVYVLDGGGDVVWHDGEDYKGLAPAVPDSILLATGYGFRGSAARVGSRCSASAQATSTGAPTPPTPSRPRPSTGTSPGRSTSTGRSRRPRSSIT